MPVGAIELTVPRKRKVLDCVLLDSAPRSTKVFGSEPSSSQPALSRSVSTSTPQTTRRNSSTSSTKKTGPVRREQQRARGKSGDASKSKESSTLEGDDGVDITSMNSASLRTSKRIRESDDLALSPHPSLTPSDRPAKRRHIGASATSRADSDSSLKKEFLEGTEIDFEMLSVSDVALLPWSSAGNEDGLYLPPGVKGLIDGMRRSLAIEYAARRKAEEQYIMELRHRVAAEAEVKTIRSACEVLQAKLASTETELQVAVNSLHGTTSTADRGAVRDDTSEERRRGRGSPPKPAEAAPINDMNHTPNPSEAAAAASGLSLEHPAPIGDDTPHSADAASRAQSSRFIWTVRDSLNRLLPSHET